MRVNEKTFAKLQKYMLFAAAFLFAFVFVAEFLFNGVSIKTKNDDVLPPVSSSNKTFYSAGSMYDLNYFESDTNSNKDNHIPFIHPAEEVVVAYFTDADYVTATVTVVPGTAANTTQTATQAATQAATSAAKKNTANNNTPKVIIIVTTLPIPTEQPSTALVEPTTVDITTEPAETCNTEPSATTEPVSTAETTTQYESTAATDASTEPSESEATTASTEPSESTAPTEASTAVTENTEPTETTTENAAAVTVSDETGTVVNAGGKSEIIPGSTASAVSETTADSSTQSTESTTATGATDVNGEKNNELFSDTHTNHNLAKKSPAFASVFTPVVIIILVILTVVGIVIRYQLQKRASKKMRHVRKD